MRRPSLALMSLLALHAQADMAKTENAMQTYYKNPDPVRALTTVGDAYRDKAARHKNYISLWGAQILRNNPQEIERWCQAAAAYPQQERDMAAVLFLLVNRPESKKCLQNLDITAETRQTLSGLPPALAEDFAKLPIADPSSIDIA